MKVFNNNEAKRIEVLDERFYKSKIEDKYYPSVTTILEAYYKGYGFNEWLKQVGYNADEIMRKAGEQGTNVHNMIEAYLQGFKISWIDENNRPRYTLNEWQMFCKFIEFFEKYKPELMVQEFTLVSDKLRFGGTVDFIGKINGEIWLLDWKTSNYLHKTYELQLAAYAMAWNELNPENKIQRTGILWLNSATRGEDKKGLSIQGKGWQIKEFDRHYEDAFKLFLHTQAIWEEENPSYKPKNLEYKMEFQLIK
jgi:hypothetical protein